MRKILFQYCATVFGSLVVLILIPLIIKQVSLLRVWEESELLYQVLSFFNKNLYIILLIGVVFIWILTTFLFIIRVISYLNETTQATSQLLEEPNRRIQLSQDLFSVQEEMNQLREKNNLALQAAKEAEQRKNDLVVYLAHDLRTPLTSVIGYLTLLQEEKQLSTELRARYTGIALEKAERLELLIEEFFEITRFNLTTLTLRTEEVDLSFMLEQITYEFLPILDEKQLKWQLEIEKSVIGRVDAEKMERVFDNLIRNAINYSFEGSTIQLILRKGTSIELKVSNEGYTIPKEKINQIFEPFYRMDNARSSSTGGTGLGLPIAKEIVQAMNGTIRADSEENRITFIVELPIN
ncbi:hypothetical protein RV02_GL002995 [Enterococcus gilvus]|nr:hypothetical protein RV02_GL002995 [Enterococcus gilvus]